MKTLFILALLVALTAAFFTRPSEKDFENFVIASQTEGDTNIISRSVDKAKAKIYVSGCTFKDCYLWVTVEKDERTVYIGAFSHFFGSSLSDNKAK